MHAAVVTDPAQPPKYQTFPDPTPEAGEVLIRVRAAGIHPVVKAIASGAHYSSSATHTPTIPGIDGVGTLPNGSRVYFGFVRKPWGTMAELAAAPRNMPILVPDALSDAEAAAIANPGMSAWMSLKERAGLAPGETVLILGATGVAGQLAIQAARQLGARRVIAAGRNVGALAAADVDAIIPLAEPEDAVREAFIAHAASGIDVVIDYLWGRPTELLLEALARGFKPQSTQRTRLVEVGSSAGPTIILPSATLRSVDLTITGSGFGSVPLHRILAAIPKLFQMAAAGSLKIAVEPLPLSDVESAWNHAYKGRRVVLTLP